MAVKRSGAARSRGGWGPTLAIIGGLGVAAIALILVPRMLLPPPPSESASPATDASSPATIGPVASFAPSPYLGVNWRLSLLPGDADSSMSAVVESDGRLVAVGTTTGSPAAWWSDDEGETWTSQALQPPDPPPSETAGAVPRTLAVGPDGLLATGFWYEPGSGEILDSVAWRSRDGRAWITTTPTGLEAGATLDQVHGTPRGFYASGFSQTRGLGWWYSADGTDWQAIEPSGIDQLSFGRPVIAPGDDMVVLGSGREARGSSRPVIYASTDWLNWERVWEGDDQTYGLVWGVTAFDRGFVAVGQASQESDFQRFGHAQAWLSNDGRGWQPLQLDEAPESGASIVAANSQGALASGWSNADGSQRAYFIPFGAAPRSTPLPFVIQGMVALPDRFVGLGDCPGEDPCGIVVAIGTPTTSAVTASPTLPPLPD